MSSLEEQSTFPVIEVAAGILWRDGCFLAAQRKKDDLNAALWEFPGGKREQGESLDKTLRRELFEELGITVQDAVCCKKMEHTYVKEGYTVRLSFFHVRAFLGEPLPREGQKIAWLTPAEALQYPFLAADRPLLTKLGALALLQS